MLKTFNILEENKVMKKAFILGQIAIIKFYCFLFYLTLILKQKEKKLS